MRSMNRPQQTARCPRWPRASRALAGRCRQEPRRFVLEVPEPRRPRPGRRSSTRRANSAAAATRLAMKNVEPDRSDHRRQSHPPAAAQSSPVRSNRAPLNPRLARTRRSSPQAPRRLPQSIRGASGSHPKTRQQNGPASAAIPRKVSKASGSDAKVRRECSILLSLTLRFGVGCRQWHVLELERDRVFLHIAVKRELHLQLLRELAALVGGLDAIHGLSLIDL